MASDAVNIGEFSEPFAIADKKLALIDQIVNAIPVISAGLTAAYSLYLMVWGLMKHTDAAKIAEVSALPEVKSIVIKASAPASSAGAAAAIDPAQPKVTI